MYRFLSSRRIPIEYISAFSTHTLSCTSASESLSSCAWDYSLSAKSPHLPVTDLFPSFHPSFLQCSLLNYSRGIDVFALQNELRSVFAPRIQSYMASTSKAVAQPGRKPSSDSAAIPLLIAKFVYCKLTQGEGAVVSNSLRTDDGRALIIREKTLRNRSDFSALAKSYLGPNAMVGKVVTWETIGDINHPDREEHFDILCRVAAALQAKDAHLNCVEVACAALLVLENTPPVLKRGKGKKRARAEQEDSDGEDSCQEHPAKNKGGRRKRTTVAVLEAELATIVPAAQPAKKRNGRRVVATAAAAAAFVEPFNALEVDFMDPVPAPLSSPLAGGPMFTSTAIPATGAEPSTSQDLSQCELEMLGNLLSDEIEEVQTPSSAAVNSGMDIDASGAASAAEHAELPVLMPQQQQQFMDINGSLPYLLDALMEAQGGPLMSLKLAASLTPAEANDLFTTNIFLLSL